MLKIPELTELVGRYDRFLTWFAVSVLRQLGDTRPNVEAKLVAVIKGTVIPVPFDLLCRHLERVNDPEIARVKAIEALWERHRLLGEIAEFLGHEVGKEFANKPLLEFMQRGDDIERAFATTALAVFGHAKAREQLQQGFGSFPKLLRWGILALLEAGGDAQWMPLFMSALGDPEPDIMRVAIQALGKSGTPGASARLHPLLRNESEQIVIAAIQAVAALREPGSIGPLLELAAETSSDRVRSTVVSALGEFPGGATQQYLGEALAHSDPRTRANAAVALKKQFLTGDRRDESLIDRIAQLLGDTDHRVRADAIQTLWELGRVESMAEIERLLGSPDEGSRASGAYLCGKLRLIQFRDHLTSLTDDTAWNVRKTAAIALLGLGESGRGVLQQLVTAGTPDQQVCAAYAVGLADDPQGVDLLLTASRSDTELGERATDLLMRLSKPADM
ncbi:MAG TPA: HEAT repeat domain-containing protein [Candidatus Ozemobacteraceae bacterium]|nr:HEAT repeat domain-containing protein [Candidatus Ozemobacteraceae bacterium]